MKQDYYQTLGLTREASADEIKSAYRKLARQHHPDVNRDNPEAEDRFKEINEAYEVLRDPDKRRRYDAYGHEAVNGNGGAGFGADFGRETIESFFDLFFEASGGRSSSRARGGADGQDLRTEIQLTLEEVMTGVDKTLDLVRERTCDSCSGSGAKPGTSAQTCAQCGGIGQIRQTQSTFLGSFSSTRPCPVCRGEGRIIPDPCIGCHGSGRQRKKETLSVKIPAGVEDGMQMRLGGQGDSGARGGSPGDLYVVIRVRPHERFERRGPDLLCEWEVSFSQAALGDQVEIPTLDNSATLTIPSGVQSGAPFTLRGHGLPRLQGGIGDLVVLIKVVTPTRLTDEQRQCFELLAHLEKGDAVMNQAKKDAEPRSGLFDKIKDFLSGA